VRPQRAAHGSACSGSGRPLPWVPSRVLQDPGSGAWAARGTPREGGEPGTMARSSMMAVQRAGGSPGNPRGWEGPRHIARPGGWPDAHGARSAGRRAGAHGCRQAGRCGCGGGGGAGCGLPASRAGFACVCGGPRLPAPSTLQVRAGRAGRARGGRAETRAPPHPDPGPRRASSSSRGRQPALAAPRAGLRGGSAPLLYPGRHCSRTEPGRTPLSAPAAPGHGRQKP
jgi:hypothetical protein